MTRRELTFNEALLCTWTVARSFANVKSINFHSVGDGCSYTLKTKRLKVIYLDGYRNRNQTYIWPQNLYTFTTHLSIINIHSWKIYFNKELCKTCIWQRYSDGTAKVGSSTVYFLWAIAPSSEKRKLKQYLYFWGFL